MGSMIPPYPACEISSISQTSQLTLDIGADTSSDDLLSLAISQWQLESSALLDPSSDMYRHINDFDPYIWATGNGWMVHGGMRVLASIEQAGRSGAFSSQIADVRSTLSTVFTSLFNQLDVSPLFFVFIACWLMPERRAAAQLHASLGSVPLCVLPLSARIEH